jgi:hypothetical protein
MGKTGLIVASPASLLISVLPFLLFLFLFLVLLFFRLWRLLPRLDSPWLLPLLLDCRASLLRRRGLVRG